MDDIKHILQTATNISYPVLEHFCLSNIFDDYDCDTYLDFLIYSLNCLKFTFEHGNEYCEIYNKTLLSEFKKLKEADDRKEVLEEISRRYWKDDEFTNLYLGIHILALEEFERGK